MSIASLISFNAIVIILVPRTFEPFLYILLVYENDGLDLSYLYKLLNFWG